MRSLKRRGRALAARAALVLSPMLGGCDVPRAAPLAPSCPSSASPAAATERPPTPAAPEAAPVELDLSWVVGAQRIVMEHSTGGLMSSAMEHVDVRRADGRFFGVAVAAGRDMYGKYSARMWKVDVEAGPIDASLRELAVSERGRPDTRKVFVEGSDSYLAWSILLEDVEVCESRTCRPRRAVRLTAQPDGHDFYHWYAWASVEGVALDRKHPDAAASALLHDLGKP